MSKEDRLAELRQQREFLAEKYAALGVKIAKAKKAGESAGELILTAGPLKAELKELDKLINHLTPKEKRDRPTIDKCIPRRLYRVTCRNLTLAVYDGKEGFIGIRSKFASRFLFTEYHWDQGPPFGTVHTAIDTGVDLPPHITLSESPGTIDKETGRWVQFDKPVVDGGRGWFFTDTDESSEDIIPVGKSNTALFEWLAEQKDD
jgi:hypothetical protein